MKIEQQVASQEISKKLKEMGVKQDAHFSWQSDYLLTTAIGIDDDGDNYYSAFTVTELGEMLKDYINEYNYTFYFEGETKWVISLGESGENEYGNFQEICAATEADARGKMLIYLIENKIIDVKEINQ